MFYDERWFLTNLAEILGAKVEVAFARQNKPLLICSGPEGPKYEAAIKWSKILFSFSNIITTEFVLIHYFCSLGFSVVNKNWLLECHERQRRVSLQKYLVGDSIVSMYHQSQSQSQFEDEDEETLSLQPLHSVPAESPKGLR